MFLLQSRLHTHSEYVSMPYNTEVAKVAKLVPYGYIEHEEHASNIMSFSPVFRS